MKKSGSKVLTKEGNTYDQTVDNLKHNIFEKVHFDSPHFKDYQDAFKVMEVNYLRLKQRYIHDDQQLSEISVDWLAYVQALSDLKQSRIMLDVDFSDNAWDNAEESMKESSIVKSEIEKRFSALLHSDFVKLPPNYFERKKNIKKHPKNNK